MNTLVVKTNKFYPALCMGYITTIICSIIFFDKIISLGNFLISASLLSYAFTYVFGNAVVEVYGFVAMRRLIWLAVIWGNAFTIVANIMIRIPSASQFNYDQAFSTVLNGGLRASLAGTVALLFGSYVSSLIISKSKLIFLGKNFWLRSGTAAAVGELVNTIIVFPLGMIGNIPISSLINIMISAYLLKLFFAVFQIPISTILVYFLKKSEGFDYYDSNIKYEIFKY